MTMKRFLILLLCGVLAVLPACNVVDPSAPPTQPSATAPTEDPFRVGLTVDRSLLYGLGEPMTEVDYLSESVQLIAAIGPSSFRQWMHITATLNDPDTPNQAAVDQQKNIIKMLKMSGVQEVIGMSHTWFLPDSCYATDGTSMPARDTTPGSEYMQALDMLYRSWKTMAATFPEITYWEVGNEPNMDAFLHPTDYVATNGSAVYTMSEKAAIATDMMYYAAKGVKEGNPDAIVVMPGLAASDYMKNGVVANFLQAIYDNIKSGKFGEGSTNTDDYFDVVAWHPYTSEVSTATDEAWVAANNAAYEVVKANGDDGKKVFFTEFGFSDMGSAEVDKQCAQYFKDTFAYIEDMEYVGCVIAFRLWNDTSSTWNGPVEKYFGLFYEPTDGWTPKERAWALQEIYGGTGELDKFCIKADQFAVGDNVALGAPVSSSSSCEHPDFYPGWGRGYVVDGNRNGPGWTNYYQPGEADWVVGGGCGAPTPDHGEWLQITLPGVTYINKFILYPRNPYDPMAMPREFYVEVSDDGVNWKTVGTYKFETHQLNQAFYEFEIEETTARYVKFNFTMMDPMPQAGFYMVQLCEIEIIKSK